jgi:hypothetical protein
VYPIDQNQDFVFGNLLNISVARPVSRQLVTGQHVVADINCRICGTGLGWKYVDAREGSQKYKIGKFILECARTRVVGGWEDVRIDVEGVGCDERELRRGVEEEGDDGDSVKFDSGDEEECDELFAGTWDREVVKARRERRKALSKARGGGS